MIGVFFWLPRKWRISIGKAYLRAFPAGRLARIVEASLESFYGFFVVLIALVFVVVDAIIPEAHSRGNSVLVSWGAMVGFCVMMSLDVAL